VTVQTVSKLIFKSPDIIFILLVFENERRYYNNFHPQYKRPDNGLYGFLIFAVFGVTAGKSVRQNTARPENANSINQFVKKYSFRNFLRTFRSRDTKQNKIGCVYTSLDIYLHVFYRSP
jgi:hypothetical protein